MNYKDIKYFSERCEAHPDHQDGMISEQMLKHRLHEEIDELRCYIEGREWVGLTDYEIVNIAGEYEAIPYDAGMKRFRFARDIESKLKEKNT